MTLCPRLTCYDTSPATQGAQGAHQSGKPFKQVVNETLRAGLSAGGACRAKPYRVKPAALGGVMPGSNLDGALTLADAIEDQELMAKMQLRK